MHAPGPHYKYIFLILTGFKCVSKLFYLILNPGTSLPGGAVVKNTPANAGDTGSSPGPGKSHMPRSN